jgi:alanine dehydrogenase
MRLLDASDVIRLLDMPSCIRAVEDAFRLRGEGRPTPSAMVGLELEHGTLHAKMASLSSPRTYVAAKVNANFPRNPIVHQLPTIQGVLVLFDGTNGRPLALMDSAAITTLRTAAVSAVAAKWLARADAATVTFVGCGVQARAHLSALRHVRRLERIFAIDPRAEATHDFCSFAVTECEIEAVTPTSLGDATTQSGIIVTTTPSQSPILDVEHVAPGTFVAAVGADNERKQELSVSLLRAAIVVVDDLEQCARYGDLHHALAAGVLARRDVRGSLDEIVSGHRPARLDDEEIIIFDSTGVAIEDVAAAAVVYERAAAEL